MAETIPSEIESPMYATSVHEVCVGAVRPVVGVLLAAVDVALGIEGDLGTEVVGEVVGTCVGKADDDPVSVDVVCCVGMDPSSTTGATVAVEDPGAPTAELPHAVVPRITTNAQDNRRPVMVGTLRHVTADGPSWQGVAPRSSKRQSWSPMNFRATLVLHGKTATGFEVPEDIVTALGAGKRPPVRVTIGDFTYRSTIAPMGGVFLIGVSAENRKSARVSAGDEVDVRIELDTEPREVIVPQDLAAALDADPGARERFEKLSYSHRRQHVLAIEDAKTAETRQRRIAKTIGMLLDGV